MRLSSVYNTKDADSDEIAVPANNTTEESAEELPNKVKLTVATSSGRQVLDMN